MILRIWLILRRVAPAGVSPVVDGGGGGAGAAAAAAGRTAGAARGTSVLRIRPPGPEPWATVARLTPRSAAILRAAGEALGRPPSVAGECSTFNVERSTANDEAAGSALLDVERWTLDVERSPSAPPLPRNA